MSRTIEVKTPEEVEAARKAQSESEPQTSSVEIVELGSKPQKNTTKYDFRKNKKKIVTFDLVNRSVTDPLNADPNSSKFVLSPTYIGSEVKSDYVNKIMAQIQDDSDKPSKPAPKPARQGLGSEYNYIYGMPDDGEDYSKYFKPISQGDNGVFISPDGQVINLRDEDIPDVDVVASKFGFTSEVLGTKEDPSLPKLVDDTYTGLNTGMDPDLLLAMDDDENCVVVDVDKDKSKVKASGGAIDDFFDKIFEVGNDDYGDDYYMWDEEDEWDEEEEPPKSRISQAPSHISRISHRSEAMDIVEEKVEHLLNTTYNQDYVEEEEEDNGEEVNWDDVIKDFNEFKNPLKDGITAIKPDDQKTVTSIEEVKKEEEEEEEEEEEDPKRKGQKFDCESVLSTLSHTANIPGEVREAPRAKKGQKNEKNVEKNVSKKLIPPDFLPKEGETKEDAKARKKAIKEYQRLKRKQKKERQIEFSAAGQKVKKSIAASGGSRGHRIINLE